MDTNKFWLSIQRENLLPEITSLGQLQTLCSQNKSIVVLFYLEGSSSSTLFRDSMIYHQGKLEMQPGKFLPTIAAAKYRNTQDFHQMSSKFKITEYPTLILFDASLQPIRTIIGFNWFQTPDVYATQKLLR